jgi:ribonuclease-3
MVEESLLQALEKQIGYTFQDRTKLRKALTHASTGAEQNYERLEFLGDRVVNLVIAHFLFNQFSTEAEGDLAKRHAALVQGKTLARLAQELHLGEVMHLSDSEKSTGGKKNENILADGLEALMGALYLDGGYEVVRRVVHQIWGDLLITLRAPPQDSKTALQEWAQARGLPLPAYEMSGRDGPDHAPLFSITVQVKGFPPVTAKGASRRKAEKEAAAMLYSHLQESEG